MEITKSEGKYVTHIIRAAALIATLVGSQLTASCGSRTKTVETPTPPAKRLEISYDRLRSYDLEQMKRLSQRRLSAGNRLLDRDSTNTAEAVMYFQDAARLVLSRPDFDHIRTLLFTDVRKRLADFDAVEESVERLADEGIWGLRVPDTNRLEKLTYAYLLNNLMAEIRPEIDKKPRYSEVVKKIRDADLQVPEDAGLAAENKVMTRPEAPSVVARQILGGR